MDVTLDPKLLAQLHRAFPGYRGNAAVREAVKRYLYLCEAESEPEILVLIRFWRSEASSVVNGQQ